MPPASRTPKLANPNRQSYAVCVTDDSPVDRDALVSGLRARRIAAKHGLACIHREPCYRNDHRAISLPESERLDERMLLLPLHPGMSDRDQASVIEAVTDVFNRATRSPAPNLRQSFALSGMTQPALDL